MNLREQYKRDGYVVKRKAIPIKSCANLYRNWKDIFNDSPEKYIASVKNFSKLASIQSFFNDICLYEITGMTIPSVVDLPVAHIMSPNLKIPDGYYGAKAHQDWASSQGSLDMVTVWIALTDCKVGNFPLEVIPRSHLDGFCDGKINGSVLEIEADDNDFIAIECEAGDAVFMSGFLIHRTGVGNGFRMAVSQRFDNTEEETFIERNYPCTQTRVVNREIKWKPTIEQVKNALG